MTLTKTLEPVAVWPSIATTWANSDPYDEPTQTAHDQAIWNALRVLQLGNLEMSDHVAAGDSTGCLFAWAGVLRVTSGSLSDDWGSRDMVGGEWTPYASRSNIGSVSAVGTSVGLGLLSFAVASAAHAEFYNTAGSVTGTGAITGCVTAVAATFCAYSGLFLVEGHSGGGSYTLITSPGTGATPTWTSRQVWSSGAGDACIATDPTGRYVLAPGVAVSYLSQDGGVTWSVTTAICDASTICWDNLHSRWIKATGPYLSWNTTAGIVAGTAWQALPTLANNITHLVALPGGLILARLSTSVVLYSEDGGSVWHGFGSGAGPLSCSNGYVAALGTEDSYVSRRCF